MLCLLGKYAMFPRKHCNIFEKLCYVLPESMLCFSADIVKFWDKNKGACQLLLTRPLG